MLCELLRLFTTWFCSAYRPEMLNYKHRDIKKLRASVTKISFRR